MPGVTLPYLEAYFFEVGPTEAGGFGPSTLTWQELDSWAARMPRGLQPWEFLMLRRLSLEWIAESQRAEDDACPAPWGAPVSDEELRAVAASLKASIKGM